MYLKFMLGQKLLVHQTINFDMIEIKSLNNNIITWKGIEMC